jgi:hypothetical protein
VEGNQATARQPVNLGTKPVNMGTKPVNLGTKPVNLGTKLRGEIRLDPSNGKGCSPAI